MLRPSSVISSIKFHGGHEIAVPTPVAPKFGIDSTWLVCRVTRASTEVYAASRAGDFTLSRLVHIWVCYEVLIRCPLPTCFFFFLWRQRYLMTKWRRAPSEGSHYRCSTAAGFVALLFVFGELSDAPGRVLCWSVIKVCL